MNIEDVRSVFGAVLPAPNVKKGDSIVPVILVLAIVGVGIAVYLNHQ